MAHFVDDDLALPDIAADSVPMGEEPTSAATMNAAKAAARDLRDSLLNGKVHGLKHNPGAAVSASAQVLLRSLNGKVEVSQDGHSWFQPDGEQVNVKEFGYAKAGGVLSVVGDGTDDLPAFVAALEVANSVAAGTWNTSGDPKQVDGGPADRKLRPVFVPGGDYVWASRLKVNWHGVHLVGPESDGYTVSNGHTARIYADHDDDVIGVNADYNPNGFKLRNVQLVKRNAHVNKGVGVRIEGTEYVYGATFDGVTVLSCQRGISVVCQGTRWLTGHVYAAESYVSADVATWYSAAGGTSGATEPSGAGPTFDDGGIVWTRVMSPPPRARGRRAWRTSTSVVASSRTTPSGGSTSQARLLSAKSSATPSTRTPLVASSVAGRR